MPGPEFSEIGATGTAFYRGFLDSEEFNTKLRGTTGASTYNKMRRSDAQVKATMLLISLPIKGATWRFEAGEADGEGNIDSDPEIVGFLNEALKQRLDFTTLLHHLLMAVPYGYEVMEKVWESDGSNVWLKKIAHRGQQTIQRWLTDEGELAGIEQSAWKDGSFHTFTIPEEKSIEAARLKLVHMAIDQEGNNFEGISMLRSAYPYWFIKENSLKIAAIGIERFALGVPMAEEVEGGTRTSNSRSQLITILKNLKTGSQSYIYTPQGYKISILGHESGRRLDPMPLIKYCDEMIAMNVLGMALKLGSTQSGSRALGDSMFGIFMLSLEAIANQVADTVTNQVVRPLLELNYPNADQIACRTRWSDLKVDDRKTIADYLQKLATSKFITPDDELENVLREIGDLPPMPEDVDRVAQMQEPRKRPKGKRVAREGGQMKLAFDGEYWRELRWEEHHVSLREIDGKQTDATEEIGLIVEKARNDWVDSLSDQINDALRSGDPEQLSSVQIPESMKKAMGREVKGVMRETFRFGRRTVRDERRRQLRAARLDLSEVALRDTITDAEIDKLFTVGVNEYLENLSGKVRALAIERARGIARAVGDEITEPQIRGIIDEVREFLGPTALQESRPLVAESFNLGRDNAAKDLVEEIQEAIYSAILDSVVCEECAGADGQAAQVGTSEYHELMPPNRRCYSAGSGANKCRCIWVYRFVEGVA